MVYNNDAHEHTAVLSLTDRISNTYSHGWTELQSPIKARYRDIKIQCAVTQDQAGQWVERHLGSYI